MNFEVKFKIIIWSCFSLTEYQEEKHKQTRDEHIPAVHSLSYEGAGESESGKFIQVLGCTVGDVLQLVMCDCAGRRATRGCHFISLVISSVCISTYVYHVSLLRVVSFWQE